MADEITGDDITDEFTAMFGHDAEARVVEAMDNLLNSGMSIAELFKMSEVGNTPLSREGARRLREQILRDAG
jgi:hypothetical protein